MAMRVMGIEDLPPELKTAAEEARDRLSLRTNEVRGLEAKLMAVTDPSLRKRLRTCRNALSDMFEAQALAQKSLHATFLRNSAGLQLANDREVANATLEAQKNGSFNLDPAVRQRIALDLAKQTQIASARVTLEADRYVIGVDGKKERATGSVIDGAIKMASKARDTLIKSRDATIYEMRKAVLPASMTDAKSSVLDLLKAAESREWVAAQGPLEGPKWALAQLDSAIAADDDEHVDRIAAAAGSYCSKVMKMGNTRLGAELALMANVALVRDGIISEAYAAASKVCRILDELREGRVTGDSKVCLALIESMIQTWQSVCGQGDVRSMTPAEVRTLLGSHDVAGTQKTLAWQVDCTWLVRDALGPEGASALRAIPSMREAVQAYGAKVLKNPRIGRSAGGSS